MRRETAEFVCEHTLESCRRLNDALGAVAGVVDSKSFNSYKRSVGRIMGELYFEVLCEIFKEYPDLEPDWKGWQLKCSGEGKVALDRAVDLVKSSADILRRLDDRLLSELNDDKNVEVYLRSIEKARNAVGELMEKLSTYIETH